MRFANYQLSETSQSYIGDWMQIIAVDELYRQMGIDLSEVVYLDVARLATYVGEYVILPVTLPLVNYVEGGLARRFSDYIVPVFLGLTMVKETLEDEEVDYLKKYTPIGCRDERTLNTLRRYGIQSFLNGCLTITMPGYDKRNETRRNKTYIVDIDSSMLDLIPCDIREKAVYRTHFLKTKGENRKELTKKLYQEYIENAGLVITSLLHCALPCLAAGIPVIFMKRQQEVSYRFSWLEKILPIYSVCDLERDVVNWKPSPADIQYIRDKVFDLDVKLLRKAYSHWADILDVSWFYENREKHVYINDACCSITQWIDKFWKDPDKAYRYSFWGVTQASECIDDYIRSRYSRAVLSHVYDKYRTLNFRGIKSVLPVASLDMLDEYVFVSAMGAREEAKRLFEEMGKTEDTYAMWAPVL